MSNTIRLGVNVDHVATIRNSRGESHPDPVKAAILAKHAGADLITAHLREDRRHIGEEDLVRLISEVGLPINLEMAATEEMVSIATQLKPMRICIVPENREELTTEGGLDLVNKYTEIEHHMAYVTSSGIMASLFIDPEPDQILAANKIGANIIELHTGSYANAKDQLIPAELNRLKYAAQFASQLGIEVHAGHGLIYGSALSLSKIEDISEFNIGHFIVAESLFVGMKTTIKKFKSIINK